MQYYSKNQQYRPKRSFNRSSLSRVGLRSIHTSWFSEKIRSFFSHFGWRWKGILFIVILLFFVCFLRFYVAIIKDLPTFDKIKDWFSLSTNITDRDGNTLYKVYDQNRQYVNIADISSNLVHATVSAEDKNFWENPGIDMGGLIRAVWRSILKWSLQWPGGSTITQQLIKNMLLTNEKTITRKLKEMVLATRIDGYLQDEVKKQNPKLKGTELDKAVKEKILEMYMNYVFLGNNAYGVEAASNTYFGKSSKDLTVFESAVLAATYQLPWTYNPYRNVNGLIGSLKITWEWSDNLVENTGAIALAKEKFLTALQKSNNSIARSSDWVNNWAKEIGAFSFSFSWEDYKVTYSPGRKDYVLSRMFEDKNIDESQVKTAVIDWVSYVFKKAAINIKAPHFVFWVQEFIKSASCGENKTIPVCYTDEDLAKWWLTIKTTLDPQSQEIAEKSVIDNLSTIQSYGANNSSLIYLDSRNGDVLAYVGSADYNDEEIDGMVDMVQQPRQPWSSIKPLVYSLWFMNLPLTLDTPIFDLRFKVGNDTPNNNDGSFMGLLPLKKALGYSRNIPAIKMYFSVGWQEKLVPFFNEIWIDSYKKNADYGYPMAIGSAELKMIELANAYMHLSAMGRPATINPIVEIRWSDGQILYQKQPKQQKQIIPEWVAHLIRKILADSANLPSSWVNNFKVKWLTYANKSGTTDMKDAKGKALPRDGWLAWYTPSKVAIFRAGNTQGNAMHANAYGGWVNGKTFRQFFSQLLTSGKIATEELSPVEVKDVAISRLSWKLANNNTPAQYKINSMGYINSLPTETDSTFSPIQIDKACMGKVTEMTPRYDILDTYIVKPVSFMPNQMDLQDIINRFASSVGTWSGSWSVEGEAWNDFAGLVVKEPDTICTTRALLQEDSSVVVNIRQPKTGIAVGVTTNIWFDVTSTKPLASVRILIDSENVGEYAYSGRNNVSDIKTVTIPDNGKTTHTISIVAWNQDGGYGKQMIEVTIAWADTTPPTLLDNKMSVVKNAENDYTVTVLFIDDISAVKWGKISMTNGVLLKKFNGSVASLNIQIPQPLTFEVTDTAWNTAKWTLEVEQYVQ